MNTTIVQYESPKYIGPAIHIATTTQENPFPNLHFVILQYEGKLSLHMCLERDGKFLTSSDGRHFSPKEIGSANELNIGQELYDKYDSWTKELMKDAVVGVGDVINYITNKAKANGISPLEWALKSATNR